MALFPDLRASLPGWHEEFRSYNHLVSPLDVRQGCVGEACPVRFIVAPTYEAGARTTLTPVHRAEMLTLLVEQTFNLGTLGGTAVEVLAETVRNAECYRLTVGDLPSAVAAVDQLVE
jgi:hypothetical protein